MKRKNPFLISGYDSPEYFCDREKETATILSAMNNGRNVTLVSPRRMGKTGLIKHVFYQLNHTSPEVVALYMDIYPTQSLGDFVRLFASTVLGQLDSVPQKALAHVTQFIKSCRPVFTFDEISGMPKASIDISPADEEPTLKEIFEYLRSSDKRCYIAIDEFQQITEYPEKNIEALLRSYMQFLPNVNFIFAGSRQHVMQEMFLSAKRPFYQSTQILEIGRIDIDNYYNFAAGFFEKSGIVFDRSAFEYLYSRFDGHTWYIQSILNRLYGNSVSPDVNAIDEAVQEVVSESAYAYENLLTAYPNNCVRVLRAIAKDGCVKEILSGDFISRHKLKAASSVSGAVKKLVNNEMIYKTAAGYIVYDRFLNEWLRGQSF